MKKLFIIFLFPLISQGQTSIFDCESYLDVSENEITAGPQLFYRPCIDLSNSAGYSFSASDNYIIQSGTSIHVSPGFSVNNLNSTGGIHLRILPNSMSWDIAVMNDVHLNNLGRYEKLELGVLLPEPLKTKLDNFILKQENPNIPMNPQDMINPFLEWELDVEAEFTHVESNTVQKVEGFFTIDKKRNYTTLLWDNIDSDYNMRIRFAPPKNGAWTAKIRIKSNNILIAESTLFPLLVVESGKHGYITVHPNTKNFELDGEVIYPVGQNFPHPDTYQDLSETITGVPSPYNIEIGKTEFRNNVYGWQNYIDSVDHYGQMGGRFTRIFMAPHAGLIEWEKKGNYYKRMHHAYEIDSLIEVHEKNNMFTMFDLLLHNYFMTWADYNTWEWDWDRHLFCSDTDTNGIPIPCTSSTMTVQNGDRYYPSQNFRSWELNHPVHPYNDNPGNYLDPNQQPKLPHDMFLLEDDIKYHEQRIRYYISRYGYSTSIYLWEQMDEIFHMSEDGYATKHGGETYNFYYNPSSTYYNQSHQAVNNYVRRMNKYIRENMEHKHQLLALNYGFLEKNGFPDYSHDASIFDPNGDCLTHSFYQVYPDQLLNGGWGIHDDPDNNLWIDTYEKSAYNQEVVKIRDAYYNANQRLIPVLFGECGSDPSEFPDKICMQGTDEKIDNMRFGFIGAAGFNKWHYFTGNNYGVYESIIRAQNHMNGQNVKNVLGSLGYLQGRQYEELNVGSLENGMGAVLEMQYYMRADKDVAVGYVYNRSVNYKTASGGSCYPSGNYGKTNFNGIHTFNWEDDGPYKKLKLIEMPDGADYGVDFYSYPDGLYLSSYTAHVGTNGKFIVEFPELNQNRALLWFVAHKLANKSLLTDSSIVERTIEPLIYPNPTSEFLYVPVSFGEITIQDANGKEQQINSLRIEEDYLVLDVSKYAQGVYLLVLNQLPNPIKFIKI